MQVRSALSIIVSLTWSKSDLSEFGSSRRGMAPTGRTSVVKGRYWSSHLPPIQNRVSRGLIEVGKQRELK